MAILKMIFLFQRRDTLVCWRVNPSTWPCTWWNNSKFTTGFRGPYLFDAFCVWIGFLLCPAIWCEKRPSHLWNHFVKLQLNWNLSRVCRKSLGPACNSVDTGRGVQITHLFVHFTIAPRRTVLSPKVDITIHQPTNQPSIAIDIWRHLKPGKQKPYLGNSGHRLKDLTTHTQREMEFAIWCSNYLLKPKLRGHVVSDFRGDFGRICGTPSLAFRAEILNCSGGPRQFLLFHAKIEPPIGWRHVRQFCTEDLWLLTWPGWYEDAGDDGAVLTVLVVQPSDASVSWGSGQLAQRLGMHCWEKLWECVVDQQDDQPMHHLNRGFVPTCRLNSPWITINSTRRKFDETWHFFGALRSPHVTVVLFDGNPWEQNGRVSSVNRVLTTKIEVRLARSTPVPVVVESNGPAKPTIGAAAFWKCVHDWFEIYFDKQILLFKFWLNLITYTDFFRPIFVWKLSEIV